MSSKSQKLLALYKNKLVGLIGYDPDKIKIDKNPLPVVKQKLTLKERITLRSQSERKNCLSLSEDEDLNDIDAMRA